MLAPECMLLLSSTGIYNQLHKQRQLSGPFNLLAGTQKFNILQRLSQWITVGCFNNSFTMCGESYENFALKVIQTNHRLR
jgi:hypothetical protein